MNTSEHEYLHGIALFNRGKFFDAHEVLEDVWRAASPEEKKTWQGLVQVAVAFHHYSTGNRVGMRGVLLRAIQNLGGHPLNFYDIQVAQLLRSLRSWLEAFDDGESLPLPQIKVIKKSQA